MGKILLWSDIDEFARRINYTLDELNYFRKQKYNNVFEDSEVTKGKLRIFSKPSASFKKLLRSIDSELKRYPLPDYFYGSKKGCSPIDCALIHLHSPYVLKLDLQKFFPSISHRRVASVLKPLTNDVSLSKLLTELCTTNYQLPQGFPTSSTLAEMVLVPLSRRLNGICDQYNLTISIYIDDIFISGGPVILKIEDQVKDLFSEMRFRLNTDKTGSHCSSDGCIITGVLIKDGHASTTPDFDKKFNRVFLERIQQAYTGTNFDKDLLNQINGMQAWKNEVYTKAIIAGSKL